MSAPLEEVSSAAELEDDPIGGALAEDEPDEPAEVWRSASDDPTPSHRRCVIHIDIDCFYAQVEMLERPELRDKPLGIQQKNIVVTSNYAARARGVGKCCLVTDALRACPELVLVNGSDLTRYRRMSARIHRLLTRFSRRVERLGFDENFLDVTEVAMGAAARAKSVPQVSSLPGHALGAADSCACGCAGRLTAGGRLASDVRGALRDELGISSCAGVGFNKLLAKLAGSSHKPDQQTVVYAGGIDDLLLSAGAARALPGVGSRTAAQLGELGVRSVADLRRISPAQLKSLGSATTASALRALAFGVDPADVKPSSAALSIGVEDGFRRVDSVEECEVKIRELARRVLVLLAEDGRDPTVLKLSIRRYNREDYGRFRESKQTKVSPSLFARRREVEVADRLVAEAMVLLKKMLKDESFHLTLLGLAVTGFNEKSDAEQAGIAKFVKKGASSTAKRKSTTDSAADDAPPGGVDPAVWDSLPPDIKSELLRDQQLGPVKRRRQQSIATFFGGAGGSGSSNSELKNGVDVVTLDDDSGCGAASSRSADALLDVSSETSRSASRSPVETLESDDERWSDDDPDDPGSPVISRSATARGEAKSAGHRSTTAKEIVECDPIPVDAPAVGVSSNDVARTWPKAACAGETEGDHPPVAGETHKSSAAGAVTPSAAETGLVRSPPSDSASKPSAATGRQTAGSPAQSSVSKAGDRSRTGTGAESENPTRTGAAAEDWDPDVFSQLPPDIQFELKMARRTERRGATSAGSPGAASPRRPAASATKTANILKFFKR